MTFDYDQSHSQVEFSVKHMMFSTVRGRFKKINGELDLNEQNPTASSASFIIDVASIDTGDEKRDGHLRSPDFFDAAQFPTIEFHSTKVVAAGNEKFHVTGNLTMHGVTKEVTLEVVQDGHFKDMQGGDRYALSIATNVNRKEYGLNWNVALEAGGVMVSENVAINIEVQVKQVAPATA